MDDVFLPHRTVGTLRVLCKQALDILAGEIRQGYITDVPGQQAVYLLKLQEADRLLAYPESPPGPHLVSEADALGLTPAEIAQTVRDTADQWNHALSPAIEGARIGGKRSIDTADGESEESTKAAIKSAYIAADAALRALGAN